MAGFLPANLLAQADAEDFETSAKGLLEGFKQSVNDAGRELHQRASQAQQAVQHLMPQGVEHPSLESLTPWAQTGVDDDGVVPVVPGVGVPRSFPGVLAGGLGGASEAVGIPEDRGSPEPPGIPMPSLRSLTPWAPDEPEPQPAPPNGPQGEDTGPGYSSLGAQPAGAGAPSPQAPAAGGDPSSILSLSSPSIDVSQGRDAVLQSWAPALRSIEAGGGPSARNLAAIILAENGAGQAGRLAPENNNWFSISAVDDRPFQAGAGVGGRFANYASPLHSVADFVDLISKSPRYADAWAARNGPTEQFVAGLAKGGYIVPEPGFPVETWLKNTSAGADTFDKVAGSAPPAGSAGEAILNAGRAVGNVVAGARQAVGNVVENLGDRYNIAFGYDQPYGDAQFNPDIGRHRGVDLVVRGAENNGRGSPVGAFRGGTVVALTQDPNGGSGVILQNEDGLYDRYFHFDGVNVRQGQQIAPGETIGTLGASGTEGFPHVHYEVSRGLNGDPVGQTIDPTPYMAGGGAQPADGSHERPLMMSSGDEPASQSVSQRQPASIPDKGAGLTARQAYEPSPSSDSERGPFDPAGYGQDSTYGQFDPAGYGAPPEPTPPPDDRGLPGQISDAAGRVARGELGNEIRNRIGGALGDIGNQVTGKVQPAIAEAQRRYNEQGEQTGRTEDWNTYLETLGVIQNDSVRQAVQAFANAQARGEPTDSLFDRLKLAIQSGVMQTAVSRSLQADEQLAVKVMADSEDATAQAADAVLQQFGVDRQGVGGTPNPLGTGQIAGVNVPGLRGVGEFFGVDPNARLGAAELVHTANVFKPLQAVALGGQFIQDPARTAGLVAGFHYGPRAIGAVGGAAGRAIAATPVGQRAGELIGGLRDAGTALTRGLPGGAPAAGVVESDRYYHGTGSAFDTPNPATFDENGLFGPGYYLTSDPRVAGSYADVRTPQPVTDLDTLRQQLKAYEDEGLEGAADDVRDEIARVLSDQRPGPNVRAVDVPRGLRLLDAEAPVTIDDYIRVHTALAQRLDRPVTEYVSPGFDMAAKTGRGSELLNNTTGDALRGQLRSKIARDMGDAEHSGAVANQVLQQAGYDGISYSGGKRIPMKDADGTPIEHAVTVIFPESLPKITNATSGRPGGLLPSASPVAQRLAGQAVGGAVAGGYAASQEEGADVGSVARGAALGAAGGVVRGAIGRRGMGQAVARAVERAGDEGTPSRYYHGTGAAFDRPNPATFDEHGLVGPAYYMTSDSNVAGGVVGDPGAVISEGYAQSGAGTNATLARYQIQRLQQDRAELVAEAESLRSGRLRADQFSEAFADSSAAAHDAQIKRIDEQIDAINNRGGQNVRAIDVPSNLNMLDLDAPLGTREIRAIVDAANDITGYGIGSPLATVNEIERGIRAGGIPYEMIRRVLGDKALVNESLAATGYDGIKYAGGKRIPMKDETGADINHDVVAVFKESLDKITNATSGQPGGLVPGSGVPNPLTGAAVQAAGGAVSGGYAASQEEGATPESVAQGALLGAAQRVIAGKVGGADRHLAHSVSKAIVQQSQNQGPTALDWIKSVGYNAMIGPTTGLVNLAGNAMEIGWQIPKDVVLATARGRPQEALAEIKGLAAAPGRAGLAALDAILHGSQSAQVAQYETLSQKLQSPVWKAVAQGLELGGRVFSQAPDEFFGELSRSMGASREAARIASSEGLNPNSAAWSQRVQQLEQDATAARHGQLPQFAYQAKQINDAAQALQDHMTFKGKMGEKGQAVQDFATKMGAFGHLVLPFWPTLFHMNSRLVERSPLGIASAQPTAEKMYDVALGSILLTGLASVATSTGAITGSGPDDPQKRDMMRTQGWRPNSTLIGGNYIPNRLFGIYGPALNAAGEISDARQYGKAGDSTYNVTLGVVKRLGNVLTDQVYFQGMKDFLDIWTDPERFLQGYATSTAGRGLPYGATLRTIATAADTVDQRRPDRAKDVGLPAAVGQGIEANIPGLRQNVPPVQNVLGETEPNSRGGLGALKPAYGIAKERAVLQPFLAAGVDIGKPPDHLTLEVKGGGAGESLKIPMSPGERREWNAVRGQELQKAWSSFQAGPGWTRYQADAPGYRVAAMKAIVEAANDAATNQVALNLGKPEIRRRLAPVP